MRGAAGMVGGMMVVGLAVLFPAGCGPSAAESGSRTPAGGAPTRGRIDPAAFDGDQAFEEVASLVALGPRDAGTEGAARAAAYVRARFEALGLAVEVDEFEEETPLGRTVFRNVIARIEGRGEEEVVVGSHYDTKRDVGAGFVGANDSGSSTGVLLELARVCREAAGPQGWEAALVFVAFDGEECAVRYGPRDGFHGSRRYVQRLRDEGRIDRVRAMILMDMIGDRDLRVTLPRNSTPWLKTLALDAAGELGVRALFGLHSGEIGDDHVAFLRAGIPAIDLIDFSYGSAAGRNDYWHTEADTLDKLSPASLEAVGKVVLHMVDRIVTPSDGHVEFPPAR